MRHRDVVSVLESARLFWPKPSTYGEDEDQEDWTQLGTCDCPQIVHQRNLLVCKECGTVYGVARFRIFSSGWSKLDWTVDFGVA